MVMMVFGFIESFMMSDLFRMMGLLRIMNLEHKWSILLAQKRQVGGAVTQIKGVIPPPRYALIDSCCGHSSALSHVAPSRSLADN